MKVVPTRPYSPSDVSLVRAAIADVADFVVPESFEPDVLRAAVSEADVLFGERYDEDWIGSTPRLKLIQIPWTGTDRIDSDVLKQAAVPVCNSHSNAPAVAEHAVALGLDAMRAISLHDKDLRRGLWRRPGGAEGVFRPPVGLRGKHVCFYGFGAIGRQIHDLLTGFDVTATVVTRSGRNPGLDNVTHVSDADGLSEGAVRADIMFVAVPLTDRTTGSVDSEVLENLGASGTLVNVSRGEVVIEADLYESLIRRRLGAAALDTWYQYPTAAIPETHPSQFPFHDLDSVVLSPHRAGFLANEAPHLFDAIDNILRITSGLSPQNVVDLDARY